jgi:WD40 repeat protein
MPPSLAKFSREEPDIVVYTGYGMQRQIQFYSLAQRKVLRTITLTHWASTLDLCHSTPLIAVGINGERFKTPQLVVQLNFPTERLVKLFDYYEGSFQDFVGHKDEVHLVKFSPNGKALFSASNSELFQWNVLV